MRALDTDSEGTDQSLGGKAAAVATLAGGAIAAGLAARNKNAASKQVDKYVEKNKGSKPIRKIDPAPFNKKEKAEPVK